MSPHKGLFYSISTTPGELEFDLINHLRSEPIFSIISGQLGTDELTLPAHHCQAIRRVNVLPPDANGNFFNHPRVEPFHQDSKACDPPAFGKMVVVWILLSPNETGPGAAPGLKLLPGVDELLPIERNPQHPTAGSLEISHNKI